MQMKKALLNIINILVVLLMGQTCLAYETVIIDFPLKQGWHKVYYETQNDETILQYTPSGQNEKNWSRSVIFHSYKNLRTTNSASRLLDVTAAQMEMQNPTAKYTYLKYTHDDAIAMRCTNSTMSSIAQCEIFRVSKSYEGLISMHYINRNKQNFRDTYNQWHNIIRGVRIYYSYYRTDRVLDKSTIFEL